jgi:tetratricopeptide (TPR) repeat protein
LKARKHFFEGKITENDHVKRQKFFQALDYQTDLPHAYVELIQTCRAAEVDSANSYASKAMRLVPSWIVPFTTLAFFMEIKLKEPEKAEQLLNEAFQMDSSSMLVWYSKAHFYARQKKSTLAEFWYKKVIAGSGEEICFPCAHNGLAGVYLFTKRYTEAEEQYKKAIFLDPNFYTSYANLGILYKTMGRYDEAEQSFQKSINIDSTYVKSYSDLGSFYNHTRQYSKAEEQFNKAIQLDSTYAPAHGYLGATYRSLGQYDEAEKQLLKAVNLDPTLGDVYTELGQLYMATKQNADAENFLKKCIQVDSLSANAYTILGLYYDETGRYVEAEQMLKKAIQRDATYGLAWYNLACNQALQKQTDLAFELLEKSLQYDPYRIGAYNSYTFLHRDTDLAPLRERKEEWTALMKKYFPGQ